MGGAGVNPQGHNADLAALHGVETQALVKAVKRNRKRFPSDFMFQLSKKEFDNWRSQTVTSSQWGVFPAHRPSPEQGAGSREQGPIVRLPAPRSPLLGGEGWRG